MLLTKQRTTHAVYEDGYITVPGRFHVPLMNIVCVGLSPSGAAIVAVTKDDVDETSTISIHDPDARCRILVPWTPRLVAVNNSMSVIAMVIRTPELAYDVIMIYDVVHDNMVSIYHSYGKRVSHLRFITNKSLKINNGVVLVDI